MHCWTTKGEKSGEDKQPSVGDPRLDDLCLSPWIVVQASVGWIDAAVHAIQPSLCVLSAQISEMHVAILKHEELPIEWEETLSSKEIDTEKWMLAIRLSRGFPLDI